LLCLYFFVLLTESLLERELRRAMAKKGIESLPLYSEERACRHPSARRVIDLFEDVQRHTLSKGKEAPIGFVTELTPLQRKVLRLLGMSGAYSSRYDGPRYSEKLSRRCAESKPLFRRFPFSAAFSAATFNPGWRKYMQD
jgi:hypothetical protein